MRPQAILLTTRRDTSEIEELVWSLGADLSATFHQRRDQPDPQFFLGSGKMEEVREYVRAVKPKLVVVNDALKPGQVFSIQRFFAAAAEDGEAVEVYDRLRLILEIFRERARSPEARLQVELAQLHYETPLVREAISMAKKGERPGFLGGGEYEVNQYYDMMKKRMTRIKRELEKMRRERGLRRKHRRRGGYHLVSLAGYTNAGKSSLLKALAPAPTLVENRYFSTLSTKTRRAESEKREILVTDTVGFIEDLPPWLVEAFHSTLEEIAFADVTLLVLDASDPVTEMARRLRSSLRILWEFESSPGETPGGEGVRAVTRFARRRDMAGAPADLRARRHAAPLLVVLNKVDRLTKAELQEKVDRLVEDGLISPDSWVGVSATTREGLPDLFDRIYEMLPDYDLHEVALPQTPETESFLAWLHENADVLGLTRGNEVHVRFEAKTSLRSEIESRFIALGATPLLEGDELPDGR